MDELYEKAIIYFKEIESFNLYGGWKNKYIYLFIISLVLISLDIIVFFSMDYFKTNIGKLFWIGGFLLIELFWLYSIKKLVFVRNDNIIKMVFKKYRQHCSNIKEAKIVILNNLFTINQNEYKEKAQDIQKMIKVEQNYYNKEHTIDKFFYYIYNDEAKSRILALFILTCSIFTIILVNSLHDKALESLIELVTEPKKYLLIFMMAFLTFLIWILLIQIKILREPFVYVSLLIAKNKTQNVEILKYLVKDLIKYHSQSINEDKVAQQNKLKKIQTMF